MSLEEAKAINPSLAPLLDVIYADMTAAVTAALAGDVAIGGRLTVGGSFNHEGQFVGFYDNAILISKPTVEGSRDGNAALTDLLTALAQMGFITNDTEA